VMRQQGRRLAEQRAKGDSEHRDIPTHGHEDSTQDPLRRHMINLGEGTLSRAGAAA
jgi:hypothetical protein